MPRRPKVIDRIRSVQDFKTAMDTLRLDLADAHDHYTLFRNLLEAKEGEYTKAVSQSQTFWSLVYGANFDAAVFRLCRVYDQDKDALTLRTFLETIKSRPTYLPTPDTGLNEAELDAALKWASQESNVVVRHLMIWRHKVYAHRDVEKTITWHLAEDYPITHDDVRALLDDGFKIVNRYSVAFFHNTWMRDVTGLKDYLKVLSTLQDRVEAWESELQSQKARANEERD